MAVVDHDLLTSPISDEELGWLDRAGSPTPAWSRPGRVLLSSLLVAAGVIHLVMVPSHVSEWLPEGLAFAAAGWIQIGLAALILGRPSRASIRVSCLGGVVLIGAWVISRVSGLPVGPEAGVAAGASFVDLTSVMLEVAAVVVGYELLARPLLGERLGRQARALLAVVPVGILILATAAVASPSALNHAHGAGGGAAGHLDDTASGPLASGGHDHGSGSAAPADDKGLSLVMNGKGEGGGHTHSNTIVKVDAATQRRLDGQLARTKQFMKKFPTVADAVAAGYYRQGPFSPGLGAHYMAAGAPQVGRGLAMTDEALQHPTLIYDGIDPGSKLAGFMYLIFSLDTKRAPEGFAGPNDHWHYHTNVCIVGRPDGGIDAPLGADTSASKELCDTFGGALIANTGYMAHVWTVPGYESPQGVFSNVNAKITCPNGTYYVIDMQKIGKRSNVCKDVTT